MEQHLYLTGEESPGAVRVVPAHHVTLFTTNHYLAQHTLWHPQISLPCA